MAQVWAWPDDPSRRLKPGITRPCFPMSTTGQTVTGKRVRRASIRITDPDNKAEHKLASHQEASAISFDIFAILYAFPIWKVRPRPEPEPSLAGLLNWPKAWPMILTSPSPSGPGLSRDFQAGPEPVRH